MKKIFDRSQNRWRAIWVPTNVREDEFKLFVEFILARFHPTEPITPKEVVCVENCPIKDEETASKYLSLMKEAGVHLKVIYPHGRTYFLGCTPEEDANFKRTGFEGRMGLMTEELFQRHPLAGRIMLERVYRFLEYGDQPFPVLTKMFPLASSILAERIGRYEEGSGAL